MGMIEGLVLSCRETVIDRFFYIIKDPFILALLGLFIVGGLYVLFFVSKETAKGREHNSRCKAEGPCVCGLYEEEK